MISVLANGKLTRDPETKVARTGANYCSALVAISNGGDQLIARVMAFDPVAAGKLQKLSKGDPVAIAGVAELSIWMPEGRDPRINLNITASAVMTLYEANKRRAKAQEGSPYQLSERTIQKMQEAGDISRLSDDLPWQQSERSKP